MKFYEEIIEMLNHVDIESLPWIYGFMKEMFFPEDTEGGTRP